MKTKILALLAVLILASVASATDRFAVVQRNVVRRGFISRVVTAPFRQRIVQRQVIRPFRQRVVVRNAFVAPVVQQVVIPSHTIQQVVVPQQQIVVPQVTTYSTVSPQAVILQRSVVRQRVAGCQSFFVR